MTTARRSDAKKCAALQLRETIILLVVLLGMIMRGHGWLVDLVFKTKKESLHLEHAWLFQKLSFIKHEYFVYF